MIYDISSYKLLRELDIEGNYLSSRKIEGSLFIITNKYIYSYYPLDENNILPSYRDTAKTEEYITVEPTEICYFPGFAQSSYMIVAGIDLNNIKKEAEVSTYLGAGSEIYATSKTLYVTQSQYEYINRILPINDMAISTSVLDNKTTTKIYKFNIDKNTGTVMFVAQGEVYGRIINQFSMDEYDDNFRIATTTGEVWNETSGNNIYILNKDLNIIGELEGLAEGEKIYSVRFMGEKGYIVTYKNVDPLFVLDLSNPKKPTVLGELKIPGYSDYLHPYRENYLIGFGKDTIVKGYVNWEGDIVETAYEVGMKMAIFDVSDFNNPKELYSVRLGDRGSSSELLSNHKALLFNEERNLIAFPAYVTESKGSYSDIPNYGNLIFEGALVYKLDLESGFTLKGKITHQDNKNGNISDVAYNYERRIQRILYIDDILYTISPSMIKANDIDSIKELKSLDIQ